MKKLSLLLLALMCSSLAHAVIVQDSLATKAGKLEIRRSREDTDPAMYLGSRKLYQFERSSAFMYATLHSSGMLGDEIIVFADCGVDNCDFRIIAIGDDKKPILTPEFGNGNDRPSITYDGMDVIIDFGEGRSDHKKTVMKFSKGKLSKVK